MKKELRKLKPFVGSNRYYKNDLLLFILFAGLLLVYYKIYIPGIIFLFAGTLFFIFYKKIKLPGHDFREKVKNS